MLDYIRGYLHLATLFLFPTFINLIQIPTLLLTRENYRILNMSILSLFSSFLVLMFPCTLFIKGSLNTNSILISNHSTYFDWLYLLLLSRQFKLESNVKIMAMKQLLYIPFIGLGMYLFDFIFLCRKLEFDLITIKNRLKKTLDDSLPYLLILFPEGTVICNETLEKSNLFMKKQDLEYRYRNVLAPKHTGLFYSIETLKCKTLFNVAMNFNVKGDFAFNIFTLATMKKMNYPKEVYFDIQEIKVETVPGFRLQDYELNHDKRKEMFGEWLQKVWQEKDVLMGEFQFDGFKECKGGLEVIEGVQLLCIPLVLMLTIRGLIYYIL